MAPRKTPIGRLVFRAKAALKFNPVYRAYDDWKVRRGWETEAAEGYPREKQRFSAAHGYPLDLDDPKSFNEKIVWKKIHDRNPLLPVIADKYRVRAFVADRLGQATADRILVPLLHVTDNPADIPFAALGKEYVIKANHGSGFNLIVREGDQVDQEYVIALCKTWLSKHYGQHKNDWCYSQIERRIIIEKLMSNKDGKVPYDVKLCMFHGKCGLIQIDAERFSQHSRSIFDGNKNRIDGSWSFPVPVVLDLPDRIDEMIAIAEGLSRDLDFIRVDFLDLGDEFFFGELTNYPASGYGPFRPRELDFELGSKWRIPRSDAEPRTAGSPAFPDAVRAG